MIERGKYQSLSMINWNGFFARTFDIDELVTTLSGGNGAGKSTTMAAFITALIPDQSLLHFRNTTEAGSSQASRDKGLFGKLQPGVCYASLDVVNSKKQRLLFGVRLQQIAGRDKKVDIKPFVIQGMPHTLKPTQLLMETLADKRARVRALNEVKAFASTLEGVSMKTFSSVADYHSAMFEFGVLPKKLRNSADRSKFYRLIEASLYGGISSAITRSLRDYLLPQNGGVKKAFQDMESALRENRMTLEAIKTTQADRDLFKHLITESTHYVASDYMRHANDRKSRLDKVLALRVELNQAKDALIEKQSLLEISRETSIQLSEQETHLEQDQQAASDHLQLVQNALRQQEKIERYLDDLSELSERLEEQMMVVEEAQDQLIEREEQAQLAEEEVDSLQMQLADYQQALDVQQTRALQYQQAEEALRKARQTMEKPDLEVEHVSVWLSTIQKEQEQQTKKLLKLKHKLDITKAENTQFEKGLALTQSICGQVTRQEAALKAKQAIERFRQSESILASEPFWASQQKELEKDLSKQKSAVELSANYLKSNQSILNTEDDRLFEIARHQELIEQSELQLEKHQEERTLKSAQLQVLESERQQLESQAPEWISAYNALQSLKEQSNQELDSAQSVVTHMQTLLETEKGVNAEKEKQAKRRDDLNREIEQLASPGGANDQRLKAIADSLGGILLSEIYDDITLDDAPYFSAMYGPARQAIVVSDLSDIQEKLAELTECPEDIYLIEGDVDAFDDSAFNVQELKNAVCVQLNDRQIRYSRFPDIPLFGRAAREQRLEKLRLERDEVLESFAKLAFDSQKLQRLYQAFSQFVARYLQVAFEPDPELALKRIKERSTLIRRELDEFDSENHKLRTVLSASKHSIMQLEKLAPFISYLTDTTLDKKSDELAQQRVKIVESKRYVELHGKAINELSDYLAVLDSDPEQSHLIEQEHHEVDELLQKLTHQHYALADLKERSLYFSYHDSVSLLSTSSELSQQLKQKLVAAESDRSTKREALKQANSQYNQFNQVLVSLKSSHQAKAETVQEFQDELRESGVMADEGAEERARERKALLVEQLYATRSKKSDTERAITATELEMKSIATQLRKADKEYKELRTVAVLTKAGWCNVLRLAREHDVERRLNRRELAYLSTNELRSISDKSLGALRLAVANNEELRDALRASEDIAYPERKVEFYIAVYQHLKQRIWQDIIRTDDPVEAIEEMEVELARLTEELSLRENRLAISSESVASIIKKTIQREQNRIRMLNQGLSNIHFGQVNGVRLNVNVRESHEMLLSGLSHQQDQHSDLFESTRYTFSEAMAKLFQRVNPHIDMGQRSPQVLGEELLDYRNYLELSIEVNRGSDGWLQAESGALSTGEAIGTGQSILLMVVQSWEEESRRLRSKDIIPCRLLFLDEAARLDSKSINTLFELCERLDMQLLIAAPENISPERGTTYKLVRKVFKDHEHVHVIGLKGFGSKESKQIENVAAAITV